MFGGIREHQQEGSAFDSGQQMGSPRLDNSSSKQLNLDTSSSGFLQSDLISPQNYSYPHEQLQILEFENNSNDLLKA